MEETLANIDYSAASEIRQKRSTESKRYLNVKELATLLGVSRWTVTRMCEKKEISFIPYGRIKRFDRVKVEEEIGKRTIKARY